MVLHGRTEIAGYPLESYESLQPEPSKARPIQRKINEVSVVQGERFRLIRHVLEFFDPIKLHSQVGTTFFA